jgi:hypothetical protein
VVAWTGRDVLVDEGVSEEFKVEVAESVAYAFSLADAQRWDAEAANQLDRRRAELGGLVFGLEAGEAALKRLLQRGSAAGVVLKAWQLHEQCKAANKSPRDCALMTLDWIDQPEHSKVVSSDARARFLRFRMWWLGRMGFEIVERERIICPFDESEWRDCLIQVESLLADEDLQNHPVLRLVEAVALFQRGEVGAGFDAFERMGQDLLVVRDRVVKRFVMSDPTGKAKRFSGAVVKLQGRNGLLKISGFPRYVRFFADEVLSGDLRLGDDLQGFGVAFNMVGPIAEFRIS